MTTLFATASKHFATVFGAHTFQKTVHALTAPVMRLIRPLHDILFKMEKLNKRHTLLADSP
jgi:hypothetical protein